MKYPYAICKYSEPLRLGASINTPHFECFPIISSDGNYLIFYRLIPDGDTGQYISIKDENGDWSEALNLGKQFNEGGIAFCASFSPDEKYIFYLLRSEDQDDTNETWRETGIYWIETDVLKSFRK